MMSEVVFYLMGSKTRLWHDSYSLLLCKFDGTGSAVAVSLTAVVICLTPH